VERLTGKTLPLSTVFGAGTVRALLAAIDQPKPRSGCIVRVRTGGNRPPVYAIPGIGGNVINLASIARALGPDQPFFALESPGLDGREPPLDSIDAIAERFACEVLTDAPREFTLLGHCWGAAVVAEMTRKLTARGHAPNGIALINPAAVLRASSPRYGQDGVSFLRSRLALYWDEFREGDWGDRTRLLASKARRAAQLAVGRTERKKTEVELRQFVVMEANRNAIVRYNPTTLEVRARVFLTPHLGDGEDLRLEWLSIIQPTPEVVPVDGRNSGDAISPAHAATLAESLGPWLRSLTDSQDA
jgi:thioesterase domain-containing protein